MRIVIDGRELEDGPTGVGRVVSGLLAAWPEPRDRLEIVARSELQIPDSPARVCVRRLPGLPWLPGTVWAQLVLPWALAGADALLAPGYGMPARARCPTAVCMHDCSFFALPETFSRRERLRRQWEAHVAARRAAFLFMGSRFAAQEAQRWLGIEPERLLVIPWGRTPGFQPAPREAIEAVRSRYRLPTRFLLFAGSGLARRDLGELLAALAPLARSHPDVAMCLVGPGHEGSQAPPGLPVIRLGFVEDPDLVALYSAATLVLYPSRYEGFGLPVLEALACGTPVIASDVPALSEVYRGRAQLVPHGRPDAWLQAVEQLLEDENARSEWAERSGRWARSQGWADSATALRGRLARAVEADR